MARRLPVGLLVACALAALAPTARAFPEAPAVATAGAGTQRTAVRMPDRAAAAARQSSDGSFDLHYTMAAGDLRGDGGEDLLVHHWDLAPADAGPGYSGRLTISAVGGSDGRRLWRFEREVTNSLPFASVSARVGPSGDPGAIVFVDSHWPSYRLDAIAVDSDGTAVWERSFATTYAPASSFTATGLPAGIYLVDSVNGRADDLLVGVLDYLDAVARLRVVLVDGADGTAVEPGPAEISAGAFPAVADAGDLDGDGRDDYVVAGDRPDTGAHVTAYSAPSGTALWSTEGVDLGGPAIWATPAGDLSGDGAPEVVASAPGNGDREAFHVLDGASGDPLWDGEGTFPYPLGDVGRDGSIELGVTSAWQTEDRTVEEFVAYAADGSLVYRRRYSTSLGGCGGSCSVFTFLLDAGDLDADRAYDLFVDRYVGEGDDLRRSTYLVRGRDGRKHLSRRRAVPLMKSLTSRGDDLLSVRPAKRNRVRIAAVDGRTGIQLWARRLRGEVVGMQEPYGSAASLSGRRGADVYATLESRGRVRVVALDGRTGALVWSRRV